MANYLCILCLSARAKLITQNFGYFYLSPVNLDICASVRYESTRRFEPEFNTAPQTRTENLEYTFLILVFGYRTVHYHTIPP